MRLYADPHRGEWLPRWHDLVRVIARVHSQRGERQLLDWLGHNDEPVVVTFVNAQVMNAAAGSKRFFEAVMCADVVLREGTGLALLLRMLNQRPGLDLRACELVPKILREHAGATLALFGSRDPWLSRARRRVARRIAPGAACLMAHGDHEVAVYARLASIHRPRVIVLGMPAHRQHEVAAVLRAALAYPCIIVCAGGYIEALGEREPPSPAWVQALGLDGLLRAVRDPGRILSKSRVDAAFLRRSLRLAFEGLHREAQGMSRAG
jgi:N-acetylglucosaminyldiphosphoundecaprenol N-acetyl-beta-D-mannosaminyltransferase